jgi:sister chromatid cohesion protein DCC1
MSSQNDAGVPLVHAPDDVGYKLLELPPELVELLESENPPM